MADGTHDLSDILVRVNWCREVAVISEGVPRISLTNGGNKSVIYDGISPLLTFYINFCICWCLLTHKFVQPHSL